MNHAGEKGYQTVHLLLLSFSIASDVISRWPRHWANRSYLQRRLHPQDSRDVDIPGRLKWLRLLPRLRWQNAKVLKSRKDNTFHFRVTLQAKFSFLHEDVMKLHPSWSGLMKVPHSSPPPYYIIWKSQTCELWWNVLVWPYVWLIWMFIVQLNPMRTG